MNDGMTAKAKKAKATVARLGLAWGSTTGLTLFPNNPKLMRVAVHCSATVYNPSAKLGLRFMFYILLAEPPWPHTRGLVQWECTFGWNPTALHRHMFPYGILFSLQRRNCVLFLGSP